MASKYTYNAAGQDIEEITNPDGTVTSVARPTGYTKSMTPQNNAGFSQESLNQIPATPRTNEQTVGSLYNVDYLTPEEQQAQDEYKASLKNTALTPVSEEEIRAKTLDRFQAEIDALNKLYATKAAAETIRGQGRLGETAALSARSGLLGSSFGAGLKAQTEQTNVEQLGLIEQEKAAKIASILSKVRSDAAAEYEAKRAAKEAGYKTYIESLAGETQRKKDYVSSNVKNLLALGYTPDDNIFQNIANTLKVNVSDVKAEYNAQKKAAAAAAEKASLEKQKELAGIEKTGLETQKLQAELTGKEQADRTALEKDLLKEGYTYVANPVQRDDLRKQGYEISVINKRTYAKAPTLKTTNVKVGKTTYLVTTDDKGNIVKKEALGSSGGGGSLPTKKTAEEKAFETDLQAARKDLAKNGAEAWGRNWNYLQNQYGVPAEQLDQILNKEQYTQ